jgi:hypothetical protein
MKTGCTNNCPSANGRAIGKMMTSAATRLGQGFIQHSPTLVAHRQWFSIRAFGSFLNGPPILNSHLRQSTLMGANNPTLGNRLH